MKTKIIAISVLLALAGCSEPKEERTKKPISEDRAESVSHAKLEQPEQVKKRNPNAGTDAVMQREIDSAKQRGQRQWGAK